MKKKHEENISQGEIIYLHVSKRLRVFHRSNDMLL